MKIMYGNTPIKAINIKHFETNTDDATVTASDMQSGVSSYARGKKVIGTGKCFEFAQYGGIETNIPMFIPNMINVIEITSTVHPVKSAISLTDTKDVDFSIPQTIGYVMVDNVENPVTITIENSMLTLSCSETTTLDFFIGKDNHV